MQQQQTNPHKFHWIHEQTKKKKVEQDHPKDHTRSDLGSNDFFPGVMSGGGGGSGRDDEVGRAEATGKAADDDDNEEDETANVVDTVVVVMAAAVEDFRLCRCFIMAWRRSFSLASCTHTYGQLNCRQTQHLSMSVYKIT